jgi:hypothetical protein
VRRGNCRATRVRRRPAGALISSLRPATTPTGALRIAAGQGSPRGTPRAFQGDDSLGLRRLRAPTRSCLGPQCAEEWREDDHGRTPHRNRRRDQCPCVAVTVVESIDTIVSRNMEKIRSLHWSVLRACSSSHLCHHGEIFSQVSATAFAPIVVAAGIWPLLDSLNPSCASKSEAKKR